MAMIRVEGLFKSYGPIKALDGLELSVKKGEIYGFLGPNGAGKTTAIKVMMGLLRPDEGVVTIKGIDVSKAGNHIRDHMGYLPERIAFYGDMSVSENLSFLCDLKGCDKKVIPGLLREFKLSVPQETKVKTLSKGMVQRLGLAQALIGNPEVLVLDEPTSGLDPEIRRWIKDQIIRLKKKGKTILLSSHVLSEVQQICDRVGVISNGRMIAENSVKNLSNELELEPKMILSVKQIDRALSMAESMGQVNRPRIEDGNLVFYCPGNEKASVIHKLLEDDISITDINIHEPDLEEVFVKIMEGNR